MNINGLMGTDLSGKIAGVVGTGKIGQSMIRILKGFNMRILAYDPYPVDDLDVEYVSMEELVKQADVITLHCPLTSSTKHLINKRTIELMKKDVYLINTSRGALINTDDLIDALLDKKFAGVALDVYEEEEGLFYEDRSNEIIRDDNLARLMTFPNVMVTSHMGFFTQEAMEAIARVTLENAISVEKGEKSPNRVEAE
jgi:D-lactate dehydrogenase